ncbi:MAG: hypothetical protein HY699_19800 [Deltaproteobacteria bacterium]|nr:hypothetical protein [Deltaproteobacteria bacterium]
MTAENAKKCLACDRGVNEVPLIALAYRDLNLWICPQHIPILIHDPARLAGRLPGAERLSPGRPPADED